MPKSAKYYIHGVIAVGTALLAVSVATWSPRHLSGWLLYLALTTLVSLLTLRLPRLTCTHSVSLLFLLYGLAGQTPLPGMLRGCYFWSWPYHLVGATAAALMIETFRIAGWQPSLRVLPVMRLVQVSQRLDVWRTDSAVWGS